MELTNIKIHFSYPNNVAKKVRELKERLLEGSILADLYPCKSGNFYVFRSVHKYVYTVFTCGNCVNVTGIREEERVLHSVQYFNKLIGGSLENIRLIYDNYFLNGNLAYTLPSLSYLYDFLTDLASPHLQIRLNREIYPGLQVKSKILGNISIFSNGKFIILGAKSVKSAELLLDFVNKTVNACNAQLSRLPD